MLAELFSIVAPVFACAVLGWGWARLGRPYDTALMTSLIFTIGAPCLVFSRLVSLVVEPAALASMALAAALALTAFGAVAWGVLRALGLPRHTFWSPLVFPNAGNMGMGICWFAFGEEGLALAVAFFTVAALGQFSVGIWTWTGRVAPRDLASVPLVYASALGAGALATGLPIPVWVLRTTELLGDFTIPLMLMTLGASLARLDLASVPRTLSLAALRLGMGAAVGFALAAALGFEGAARGVLVLQCSMPAAVFNYLFAERYGRSPQEVASLVLLSTLAAFATIPLLLAWLTAAS
jgi:predicted permease